MEWLGTSPGTGFHFHGLVLGNLLGRPSWLTNLLCRGRVIFDSLHISLNQRRLLLTVILAIGRDTRGLRQCSIGLLHLRFVLFSHLLLVHLHHVEKV